MNGSIAEPAAASGGARMALAALPWSESSTDAAGGPGVGDRDVSGRSAAARPQPSRFTVQIV